MPTDDRSKSMYPKRESSYEAPDSPLFDIPEQVDIPEEAVQHAIHLDENAPEVFGVQEILRSRHDGTVLLVFAHS